MGRTEAVGPLGRGPRPMGCQAEQERGDADLYAPAVTAGQASSWKERTCKSVLRGNDMDRAGM